MRTRNWNGAAVFILTLALALPGCAHVGRMFGQILILRDSPSIALALYTHCLWLGGVSDEEIQKGQIQGSFTLTFEESSRPPTLKSIRTTFREPHGHDPKLFASCDAETPGRVNALLRHTLSDADVRFSDLRAGPLTTLQGTFFPFGEILAFSGDGSEPTRMEAELRMETPEQPVSRRYSVKYFRLKEHWYSTPDRFQGMELALTIGRFEEFPLNALIDDGEKWRQQGPFDQPVSREAIALKRGLSLSELEQAIDGFAKGHDLDRKSCTAFLMRHPSSYRTYDPNTDPEPHTSRCWVALVPVSALFGIAHPNSSLLIRMNWKASSQPCLIFDSSFSGPQDDKPILPHSFIEALAPYWDRDAECVRDRP